MAQIHVLPLKLKRSIATSLNTIHSEIDEVVCIVKFKNGDCEVLETESSFEFKCISVKLLDFQIKQDIEGDTEY